MTPQLFIAKTMHRRFFPAANQFVYKVYYLALPLSTLPALPHSLVFAVNRPALFSFYAKDYGGRDGGDLKSWAIALFAQHGIAQQTLESGEIILITMPRILGYAFNPVSFWLCFDAANQLRAVIAEVNNTFGETHSYLCANPDGGVLDAQTWLHAEKIFHVSPFLSRKGTYLFRFNPQPKGLGIWIDYFMEADKKQLATSLIGTLVPFSQQALLKAFFAIPFVTLKTIFLIHWQALMLALKKIRYHNKPPQHPTRSSKANTKGLNF